MNNKLYGVGPFEGRLVERNNLRNLDVSNNPCKGEDARGEHF